MARDVAQCEGTVFNPCTINKKIKQIFLPIFEKKITKILRIYNLCLLFQKKLSQIYDSGLLSDINLFSFVDF